MKSRAALYARVSTYEQVSNYSIKSQLEITRMVAESRNYEVVKEYVDEGQSGTLLSRPALNKLLSDCRNGKIDVIIVFKIDRFFRDIRHLLYVMDELEKLDVKFISATEPFDTSTPIGRYILGQFGLAAELERSTFLERAQMGRIRRMQEGKWWGAAPYGYTYNTKTGKLELNESEAEVVRQIFKLYRQPGASVTKVARELNKKGYLTRAKKAWKGWNVDDIIRNETYTGTANLNRRSKNNAPVITVEVPAIVSKEEFNEIKKLSERRKKITSKKAVKRVYLLKSLVYCAECGAMMGCKYTNPVKYGEYKYYYYICRGGHLKKRYKDIEDENLRYKKKAECKMGWVRAEKLEDAVWKIIVDLITDPDRIKSVVEKMGGNSQSSEKDSSAVEKKLKKLSDQRRALFRSYRESLLPEEDMRVLLGELAEEEKRLLREMEELKPLDDHALRQNIITFEHFHEKYKNTINELSEEERREIIVRLVNHVKVDKKGDVKIYFNLPDNLYNVSMVEISTKLEKNIRPYRKRKPGRKSLRQDINISMSNSMWENIEKEANRRNTTPTELIRLWVIKWVKNGRGFPGQSLFNKSITEKDKSQKRLTTKIDRKLKEALEMRAKEARMSLAGAVRYIIEKSLT